jgi:small nuclear ribonucleoprotein (snRNP)-like protein
VRDRLLKKALRERFYVTLKSGETFDGLLDESDPLNLTLVDAHAHLEQGVPTAIQGELWLRWDNVAYLQRAPR